MSRSKENVWVLIGKDGRTHTLPQGMIFIGREECEIILQAVSADKRHAVVCFNGEAKEYMIKDLNSLTGTYVNGIRIPEQTYVKLKHLDCIRFGYGPDVFYLEKSVCSPRLKILEKDSISAKICKEEGPHDSRSLKNCTKLISPLQKLENQPFNRTDLPPDSLPLNLNNHEDGSKSWCEAEENLSDSPDYSQRSESSSCSAPANVGSSAHPDNDASSTHSSPAAMAFTVAFENEVTTPRKKLGIRDSIRKFAPNKPDGDCRPPFQKNCKAEPSPKKLLSEELKSTILPAVRPVNNLCPEQNENSKIQDSASFLIKKMLNTRSSSSILENGVDSDKNEPQIPLVNDANDDHSEAGTYTVEAENDDCDVEEARKRIDEVFGVIQLASQVPLTQPSNTITTTSAKQIPCLTGRMKQGLRENKNSAPHKQRIPCEPEPSQLWGRTNKAVGRGKRLIPVPSNTDISTFSDRQQVESNSLQRLRRTSDPPLTPERARRVKLATSPKSAGKSKTISTLKSTGIPTNNLSALPVEKNSTTASDALILLDDSSHHRSSDNRSEGSKSPHSSTGQWRKVPWNLSGSDAELDQSKSENNSVISDTSTEPSSHSSHSGKNKPEHGPQMRLNRAFALRRARLEADSAKRGKENKALSGSQKAMKKSSKLSASTTALREDSICSGKTNYRLTAAIAKPVPGKSALRGADARSEAFRRKPELKSGHRRIESDPGKGIPVWRMDSRPATVGGGFINSCHRGSLKAPIYSPDVNNLQSFHRSMSCSVMNEADVLIPSVPCSFVRSFEHSIISGSQIVTGQNMDDFHTRKHPNKELTALDCLVISAVHQLSSKLWTNSKALLEKEREKCSKGSDSWLMIEEVLPNVPVTETPEDGDLTKDLSNILKNLKRVEQGLEVLSCVLDSDNIAESNAVETKPSLPQNFFIVDM